MKPGDKVLLHGPLERREQPHVGKIGTLVRQPDLLWCKNFDPDEVPSWIVDIDGKHFPLFEDEIEVVEVV